jgi:hypothetical protein
MDIKAQYIALVGYDPFEDDPANTVEDVTELLITYCEHVIEDCQSIPDLTEYGNEWLGLQDLQPGSWDEVLAEATDPYHRKVLGALVARWEELDGYQYMDQGDV